VGYVEVGHITQSHIDGAGHERGYRKSHQSADGSGFSLSGSPSTIPKDRYIVLRHR
jgi:hypothetical protein